MEAMIWFYFGGFVATLLESQHDFASEGGADGNELIMVLFSVLWPIMLPKLIYEAYKEKK